MKVFGIREKNKAVFVSNEDPKLFGILSDIPSVQEKGVTFVFTDLGGSEDEALKMILPMETAQELISSGRLTFGK